MKPLVLTYGEVNGQFAKISEKGAVNKHLDRFMANNWWLA